MGSERVSRESEIHETVETPNWDTKQRCSCGAEFASRAELYFHQAPALRAEVVRLRTALRDYHAMTVEYIGTDPHFVENLFPTEVREVARAALGEDE